MPQGMHRNTLVDLRDRGGGMDGPVELAGAQGFDGVQARKQPAAIEHLALGAGDAPPDAQAFEQHGREHGVAILVAFALFDAQGHALAVDVADLECNDFTGPQSGAVGEREGGLVLQVAGGSNQAADFLAAQHHGELVRHVHGLHLRHQFATIERDVEEELQSNDRGVERNRRGAAIHQVQLIVPQVLDARRVRRTTQIRSEPLDGAKIAALRLGIEFAHPHVVDHALAQRGDNGRR